MTVVARAYVTVQAESDAEVDAVWRALAAQRDEAAEVYVSIAEVSRELER